MIRIEGVTKQYRNADIEALKSITLTINQGEFITIIGPSGCGKTTLLNLIGLIDTANKGKYYLCNKDVAAMTSKELDKIRGEFFGYIFQHFYLVPTLSSLENIALPLGYAGIDKKERIARALEMLEIVGLPEKANSLPAQLSGGQQQRIAIARAIITRPQIILADEPTGNLDSKSGEEIKNMLVDLNKNGIALLMVTHDLNLAKLAPRTIHMSDGIIENDCIIK